MPAPFPCGKLRTGGAAADRRQAQQRVDRIRAFREQLDELAREGVLTLSDEQRDKLNAHLDGTLSDLAARFDVDVTDSQKQLSLGMRIVSALGGLALCLAVFFFFYRIWGALATPFQVAILILTPLVLLVVMDFAARRERTLYFTALVGLVAFAAFVTNLFVLGKIFNLAPSQHAFLAWSGFALALAYSYRLRILLVAGLVCLGVWVAGSVVAWAGGWWGDFGLRPETILLFGCLLLALAVRFHDRRRPEFAAVYRVVGLLTVFCSLLALGLSAGFSFLSLPRTVIEAGYQCLSFLAAAGAIWLGVRYELSGTLNIGAAFFTVYLVHKFVDWWWDWMPRYLFFLLVGAIALGLLWLFRRLRAGIVEART